MSPVNPLTKNRGGGFSTKKHYLIDRSSFRLIIPNLDLDIRPFISPFRFIMLEPAPSPSNLLYKIPFCKLFWRNISLYIISEFLIFASFYRTTECQIYRVDRKPLFILLAVFRQQRNKPTHTNYTHPQQQRSPKYMRKNIQHHQKKGEEKPLHTKNIPKRTGPYLLQRQICAPQHTHNNESLFSNQHNAKPPRP